MRQAVRRGWATPRAEMPSRETILHSRQGAEIQPERARDSARLELDLHRASGRAGSAALEQVLDASDPGRSLPKRGHTMRRRLSPFSGLAGRLGIPTLRPENLASMSLGRVLSQFTSPDTTVGVFWAATVPCPCRRSCVGVLRRADREARLGEAATCPKCPPHTV
jgi:hypothetical protein